MITADQAVELGAKCRGFRAEIEAWQKLTTTDLKKHTSQVSRLAGLLLPLEAHVAARVADAAAGKSQSTFFELAQEVLALGKAWAPYRQKLTLRFFGHQRTVLDVADELAYRFWRPAYAAAASAAAAGSTRRSAPAKEPPLVYLQGDISPFIATRDTTFEVERVFGERTDLQGVPWAAKILGRTPVPIVALPYSAASHIGDLLVLAHEIGHAVEADFALGDELAAALDARLANADRRRDHWLAWASEVFADLWGTLVAGPAFARALERLVVNGAVEVTSEVPSKASLYPPTILRLLVIAAALERLEQKAPAAEVRARAAALGDNPNIAAHTGDIDDVVTAIFDLVPRRLGVSVREASGDHTGLFEAAATLATNVGAGNQVVSSDPRIIAMAVEIACATQAASVLASKRHERLWEALANTLDKNAVRATHGALVSKADFDAAQKDDVTALIEDLG